jgi:ferric-dicitrate binding protein FerR (iron transport regulator)
MDENHQDITPPTRDEADQMWGNILSDIRKREQVKKKKNGTNFSIAAAIAILFIVGGIFGYVNYIHPDIYISASGTRKIILADHTEVTLLKGAELTVERTFPADTREVFLEGDATFKVAKSKQHPFIVHGQGYETKVLGTVFKVSQSGSTFKVDLFEGKVLVYKSGHSKDTVRLAPKQTFTNYGISEATSVSEIQDKRKTPSTIKLASLTFTNCPINDAIQVVEKTYGIKVQYPRKLENTKISITVPPVTADTFLQTLAIKLNLNSKRNHDSIFELEK